MNLQTFTMLAVLGIVSYLLYKLEQTRKDDERRSREAQEQNNLARADARASRAEITTLLKEIMKMLTLVHGWTVVSAKSSDKTKTDLEKESRAVQASVEKVETKMDSLPTQVADEVEKRTH